MFLYKVTEEQNKRYGRRRVKYTTLFNYWKNVTNIKASLAHTGKCIYKYWTGFNVDNIWKQVGLYDIDGIAPSSRIEVKFKSVTNYLTLCIPKQR